MMITCPYCGSPWTDPPSCCGQMMEEYAAADAEAEQDQEDDDEAADGFW